MAKTIESYTDVLIIGAGPSGLMAAYWMARCGVNARVIDKKGTKVFKGHADGLRSRTLELLDSIGVAQRVLQEGHEVFSMTSWGPDENGKLCRQVTTDLEPSPPYAIAALSQGRIERFLLDAIAEHSNLEVERGVIGESLEYDEGLESDPHAYPITLKLRTLSEEEASPAPAHGVSDRSLNHAVDVDDQKDTIQRRKHKVGTVETLKAKYVIGCDGAHSWTRKQLNIPFEGSTTDHIWGVIDIVPITNYPDMRRIGSLTNASGTVLIVPREKNLVRFYVPLQEEQEVSQKFDRLAVTLESVRQRVKKIMSPFYFDFDVCDWWTVYQVGRRIAQTNAKGRVYLAGDAVHTHSPKVGMGLNMSMQDGFNIGWKVALVAKGLAKPSILDTYKSERYPLAEMLLDFDRQWSALFLQQEQQKSHAAPVAQETLIAMRDVLRKTEHFSQGHTSYYRESPLVCKQSKAVAQHLTPGEKLVPVRLRSQANGLPSWTTKMLESDGRFRILLLAGDVRSREQASRVWACGDGLARLLRQFTPAKDKLDSLIDVRAIHSAPFADVELDMFPSVVYHFDENEGCDLTKVWSDSACSWGQQSDGKGYETWGVDRLRGGLIAMRPDQYIGWMGELEDVADLARYLQGIFVKREARPML
ncbi:putative phenol 2-monooxygenase [Aspergillus brunneoviolaceus CBS 621.78]|uniref:2-polyprenyl-6-methoxyphenol hydroxylase n=1 Tax=Aspergillus brunneoviolaceus CBS 621.78 TaxID=1450534 RepID=A0ACD1G6E0_9EURO|nr:2-polyprenyl-6-methoxyphenol hydroxylase [Aspergillus brunneoviolaceus CBS 621.78]RAH44792.1 2-polyprenyl-6-methoxyphenol hydroxylase [Aspergillus brunneoviolaceus CBS 621.78]